MYIHRFKYTCRITHTAIRVSQTTVPQKGSLELEDELLPDLTLYTI